MTATNGFSEHRYLADVCVDAAAATAGGADHGEYGQGIQSGSGHKNTLCIGAHVGWIHKEAFRNALGKVVGHHGFQHFVVFELEADPKSFSARTAGKGFAAGGIGVPELADEVHAFDVPELDGDHIAGGIEQIELALMDEIGRGNEAIDRVPVHFADDYLLVGRGHSDMS